MAGSIIPRIQFQQRSIPELDDLNISKNPSGFRVQEKRVQVFPRRQRRFWKICRKFGL